MRRILSGCVAVGGEGRLGAGVLLCVLVLLLCVAVPPGGAYAQTRYRDEVFSAVQSNTVAYGSTTTRCGGLVAANQMHQLDLYEPQGDTEPARAGVVILSGGRFTTQDRKNVDIVAVAQALARRGYVAAPIDYRVCSDFGDLNGSEPFFAGVVDDARQDAMAAVRWMRANAAAYRLDPNRITIAGYSAGAVASLLVNFDPGAQPFTNDCCPTYAANVCAVADLAGATDTTRIDAGDPPVLIVHGDLDSVAAGGVPFQSALDIENRCNAVGVPVETHYLAGVGHDLFAGGRRDTIVEWIADFFYRRAVTGPGCTSSGTTIASGTSVVWVNRSNGQLDCLDAPCSGHGGLFTFDDAEYVPGVNLGQSLGSAFIDGAVFPAFAAGPPVVLFNYGSLTGDVMSVTPGLLGFHLVGNYVGIEPCVNGACAGGATFLGTLSNLSGSQLPTLPPPSGVAYTMQAIAAAGPAEIIGNHVIGRGKFTINTGAPVDTPTGPASVSAGGTFIPDPATGAVVPFNASITFERVTRAGRTFAQPFSTAAGLVDPRFAVSVGGYQAVFLDVTTTAEYSGQITTCLRWSDTDGDGFVDGTAALPDLPKGIVETSLRLLHRESLGGMLQFVDRTVDPVDTGNNVACAETTSLSPFVIVVQTTVPGGGDVKTDCASEWNVGTGLTTNKKGKLVAHMTCKDGQSCDDDTAAGQCTVSFSLCPNVSDQTLPLCTPTSLTTYELSRPLPSAKDPTDAANGAAVLAGLEAFAAHTLTGKKGNVVTFSSALTGTECSGPIAATVPLQKGEKGNKVIKVKAKRLDGKVDTDTLKIECTP